MSFDKRIFILFKEIKKYQSTDSAFMQNLHLDILTVLVNKNQKIARGQLSYKTLISF